MASINNIILTGRLGSGPTFKTNTQGEKYLAIFNIANTFRWKNKNTQEYEEKTIWWSIIVYHKNTIKYLTENIKIGNKVLIQGSVQDGLNSYTNEKDYSIQDKVIIIGSNKDSISLMTNDLSNYNAFVLVGHVGQDPKVLQDYDGNDQTVIMNVAYNYGVKNKETGEFDKKTMWNKIIFKDQFNVSYIKKYIKSGLKVMINGVLSRDSQEYKKGEYSINAPYIFGKNITVLSALEDLKEKKSKINEDSISSEEVKTESVDFDDDLDLF